MMHAVLQLVDFEGFGHKRGTITELDKTIGGCFFVLLGY